ncbi:MAG: hypothetical protein EOL95_05380 [Bacteroidia bacterium]|nr:hypothetical protein [Bacteroidia bacterium]
MYIIGLIFFFLLAFVLIIGVSILSFLRNVFKGGKRHNSNTSSSSSSEDRMASEYLKKKLDKNKAEDIDYEEVK